MSCEQTLNNINSVVNAMSNTQGDMVSDVEQLKKNWEDFSTLFAQLVEQNNIMNENQKIIVENQVSLGSQNVEIMKINLSFKEFFNRISRFLGV